MLHFAYIYMYIYMYIEWRIFDRNTSQIICVECWVAYRNNIF